ncbi:uncharacterized protein LOC126738499 isoform X2 [Anthonomus grandis grandis]|nr:uncharacterized protein LOC126738499 isoform X2 [Anthonomus grandis grandis]
MTLPVALLIASYNHESISEEIREIAGETNLALLESLSCKCRDHSEKSRLVPPGQSCSSDGSSPTSEIGSETSENSVNTTKSYSYFSEINQVEEILDGGVFVEKTDQDVGRSLRVLIDIVENVTSRMNDGYGVEELEVKINYQNRDLLDLGKNIQGSFPLRHPPLPLDNSKRYHPRISICKHCPVPDCAFQEVALIHI